MASKAEITLRVNQVFKLLLTGTETPEIRQFMADKWGVAERTQFRYLARANEQLVAIAATQRDRERGRALARLNMLFRSALQLQDYKTCLQVQREINTLLGLYAPAQSTLRIDDWRSQAIEDIRRGAITYDALAQAFDDTLAAELFRSAGVEVSDDADRA